MRSTHPTRRTGQPSEEGYILVAVVFLALLLTIALSVAMPRVIKQLQRDHEVETMHRGKEYAHAIKLYYRKFGAYPPNVDAVAKPTNMIRFLRKKYTDPITGKDDWKPILLGQNKAPTAFGFFGQPLMGTTIGGVGPGAAGSGLQPSGLQATSTADPSSAQPQDPKNPSASGASDSTSAFGQTGQTFGGAGIIGFEPASPKQSILTYKKKNHYNEWEFVYDPRADQTMIGNIGLQPTGPTTAPGLPMNSPQSPPTPTPSPDAPSPSPAPAPAPDAPPTQ